MDKYLRGCQIKQKFIHSSLRIQFGFHLVIVQEIRDNFFTAARVVEEYPAMVSDILTAVIVFLMAVLVIYPTTRVLLQSWHNWQRRHGHKDEIARRR